MLILYLLQALVPPALIAWLAFLPPRSAAGFWTQASSTAVALVAISITGIWAFPPWWTPFAFGALLAVAVVTGLVRRRTSVLWPSRLAGWITLVGFAVLGLFAADQVRAAMVATTLPDGRIVDLASPLGPGTYLVANGGVAPSVNAHATLLDASVPAHRDYRGTAHGVDLVAINRWGLRADGVMPADPQRYEIFGRPVVAPCAGDVIAAVDGLADMPVPQVDRSHLAGNHVILRCADADILLGHFHRGSVRVWVGQRLSAGEAIAQVGNSGNTSEPHLHINAQAAGTAEAPFSGAPVPIRINGRYLARNDRLMVRTRPVLP